MQCIKDDKVELMGDYQSGHAKLLQFYFERCKDEPNTPEADKVCKKDAEIDNWLRGRYMIFLENVTTFEKDNVSG